MIDRSAIVAFAGLFMLLAPARPARADDYARQPGVDAQHYTFKLELSDTTDTIHGEATDEIKFVQAGVSEFTLDLTSPAMVPLGGRGRGAAGGVGARGRGRGAPADGGTSLTLAARGRGRSAGRASNAGTSATLALRGMMVESVTEDGAPVQFDHGANKLHITLAASPAANSTHSFTIEYHGIPATGLRIGPNKYGDRSFFSTNWPDLARQWLPVIDHPSDKATSEFLITAPAHYQAIANGALVEEKDLGDGRKLTHWKESTPIATWLNAIGVEEFAVHSAGKTRGVEVSSWVAKQDAEAGPIYFEGPAEKALDWYSEMVGPYSYEKLANVACPALGGGTEHASEIFYGESGVRAQPATALVAHEVAHQWFGDSVTESSWDEVWLSEGFATYFALLYAEHYESRDAFVAGLLRSRNTVFATERSLPEEAVIHRNMVGTRGVLNQLVYQKGSWVLHMLRAQVGTDDFWKGLRTYYERHRNGSATTADLQAAMEDVSGQKLGWFFDQWLRRAGSPAVEGTWNYNAQAGKVHLELTQTQAGEAYRMPLEVGIKDAAGQIQIQKITLDQKGAKSSDFAASAAPADVILDPNTWMLMHVRFGKAGAPPTQTDVSPATAGGRGRGRGARQ